MSVPESFFLPGDAPDRTPQASGIGLAQSELYDQAGAFGRSLQSLVVAVR